MGIDIYAMWKGQTEEEKEAQITGFSVVDGHVGYLREAYHGEPYATRHLVPEAFEAGSKGIQIPATLLRSRLARTLELVEERERSVYHQTDEAEIALVMRSFVDFVELCETKERATKAPVTISASY